MSKDIDYIRARLHKYYEAAIRDNHPDLRLDVEEVPPQMIDRIHNDGTAVWKLIPSTVTKEMISDLESKLKCSLPPMYSAYLKSCHHLFQDLSEYEVVDKWNGRRRGTISIANLPCDNPLRFLEPATEPTARAFSSGFQRMLSELGYIVIGWNICEWCAFDTNHPVSGSDYRVVAIAHSLESSVFLERSCPPGRFDRLDLSEHVYTICGSFRELVEQYFKYPEQPDFR